MKEIKDLINGMDYNQLLQLKAYLSKEDITEFVDKELNKKQLGHETYCTTCMGKIDPNAVNNFTLVFGRADFRKKATFCAVDCMEYFLKNLKEISLEVKN